MESKTKILLGLTLSLFLGLLCGSADAHGAIPSGKTTVFYFGQQSQDDFEKKVKPVFSSQPCKNCELVNATPYTKEGAVDMAALHEKLANLPDNASFVFFDFNMKVTDQNKNLVDILNQKADKGLLVVGSAGAPKSNESSGPLSRTLLGQVKNALIIGELGERDRLAPSAFYGPEMLTALRPPKDKMGQGYSPLLFAAALADHWPKRDSQEWSEFFKKKKAKTRKIWLELGDLFY